MVTIVGIASKHVKRVTCSECSSILEYTDSDTVQIFEGEGTTPYDIIDCPKCSNVVKVK